MQHSCNQCLYDISHPFGLSVYREGCSGCYTHRQKYDIDWASVKDELMTELAASKIKRRGYDCVVAVVGDAEDYFVLNKVLGLGLTPLVVAVNDYFKNDIGWHNLHNLITQFDVDSLVYNPDIRVYKELVRTSLRKYDHILLPFLSLHTAFPVHIAYERNIPLVIWGQNQAVEQVGKFSHCDRVQMSKWSRKEHDLFGCDVDTLIGNGAQIDTRQLNYYQYPDISKLSKKKVKGLYLSNYFPWDPLAQNQTSINFGFRPQRHLASFDIYERAGSSVYYQLHDVLKYKRVGYRKVRDHLVREIRHGRISRSEAASLEEHFSQSKVDVRGFFDWLGVSSSGYQWFKKHRLNSVKGLISESEITEAPQPLPAHLSNLLNTSYDAAEDFVCFGKGVYI